MVTLYLLIVAPCAIGNKRGHTRQGCRRHHSGARHHVHAHPPLGGGAIIELDASEEDAVSILANNLPVARGTVVVNGNRIAVNVAELLPRPPDMR
jgi:flagellar motor switch protein FliN